MSLSTLLLIPFSNLKKIYWGDGGRVRGWFLSRLVKRASSFNLSLELRPNIFQRGRRPPNFPGGCTLMNPSEADSVCEWVCGGGLKPAFPFLRKSYHY